MTVCGTLYGAEVSNLGWMREVEEGTEEDRKVVLCFCTVQILG